MASITIRNLDDDVKTRLRVRAAEHHRSMEEEVRIILRDAVNGGRTGPRNLTMVTRNVRHFSGTGVDVVDPWAATCGIRPRTSTGVASEMPGYSWYCSRDRISTSGRRLRPLRKSSSTRKAAPTT